MIGPHYASSKSAMHGLMHWIATRYAKEGIVGLVFSQFLNVLWWLTFGCKTCNAVAPALIVGSCRLIGWKYGKKT